MLAESGLQGANLFAEAVDGVLRGPLLAPGPLVFVVAGQTRLWRAASYAGLAWRLAVALDLSLLAFDTAGRHRRMACPRGCVGVAVRGAGVRVCLD